MSSYTAQRQNVSIPTWIDYANSREHKEHTETVMLVPKTLVEGILESIFLLLLLEASHFEGLIACF